MLHETKTAVARSLSRCARAWQGFVRALFDRLGNTWGKLVYRLYGPDPTALKRQREITGLLYRIEQAERYRDYLRTDIENLSAEIECIEAYVWRLERLESDT